MAGNSDPIRKSVTLPENMWQQISEYRFRRRIPVEAEAVRQLLERGWKSLVLENVLKDEMRKVGIDAAKIEQIVDEVVSQLGLSTPKSPVSDNAVRE
ncbi:MAG: hypothetical protein F8N37_06705 [Telmatospirillum sp.]|nr:hypothetical protein [Telmatospirillum sp.]